MTVSNAGGSRTCGPATVTVAPLLVCDGTPQTPSSGTYTVPTYTVMTVEAWGGGGAGGTGGLAGNTSSFNGTLIANGGDFGGANGSPGAGGTASGGDITNGNPGGSGGTNGDCGPVMSLPPGDGGSAPNGGVGGAGSNSTTIQTGSPGKVPGAGGGGGSSVARVPGACGNGLLFSYLGRSYAGGGSGGYVKKTYSAGALTPSSQVTIVVGSGGDGSTKGGAGASGQVKITCSTAPVLQCDGTTQTPSSGTYAIPTYSSMTVEMWGGGASGGGANTNIVGVPGNSGTQSSFSSVIAYGGTAPGSGLTGGAGGTTNSAGDVNTNGNAGGAGWSDLWPCPTSGAGGSAPNISPPNGGAGVGSGQVGNPGSVPGGAGSGGSTINVVIQQNYTYYCRAAPGGGGGGYSKKTYSAGDLTPGSAVNITVGSGGAAPSAARTGGAGAPGQVKVACSATPTNSAPTDPDISGPTSGFTKTEYTYTFQSTDPDSDTIRYYIDWSGEENIDSDESEWVPALLEYVPSGTATSTTHSWNSSNTQTFSVLAEDSQGNRSGWTSYSVNMSPNAPTVLLTASSDSYTEGDPQVVLTWSSSNASSCTGTNFSTDGATQNLSPGVSVTPTETTTYTITCTGPGGEASDFEDVTYACQAAYSCSGQTIQYTNTQCAVSNVTTCVSPQFCSPGSAVCLDSTPSFNEGQDPNGVPLSGHLELRPSLIRSGGTATAYWNVSNVSSCTVSGNTTDSWTGISGSQTTSPIIVQTSYTLDCTKLDGTHLVESATINIVPVFEEK